MTGHQLIESWRRFALQLKTMINAHEDNEASEIAIRSPASLLDKKISPKIMEEMEPLFEEQVTVLSTALRHNLSAVQSLFNTAGEVPDPTTYWNRVAEKMEITPKQRESFISLWNAYVSRIASLQEQRTVVVKSLIQAAGLSEEKARAGAAGTNGGARSGDTTDSNAPLPVDTLNLMMKRYCTLFDATGNVAATPDNELAALLDLMREAGKIWSLYQKAKITALSYPAFPDIVHFLKAVAGRDAKNSIEGNLEGFPMLANI
jgi:hypothetical protein